MHWCEGIRSPGTGVTDSCELPCGCWELNLCPLGEQPALLTSEPSLQPLVSFLKCVLIVFRFSHCFVCLEKFYKAKCQM